MLGCVFVTLQAVEFSIHISMYYILISLMLEICYSRIKTHEIWCIIFSLLMVGLRHGKIFLCSSFFFSLILLMLRLDALCSAFVLNLVKRWKWIPELMGLVFHFFALMCMLLLAYGDCFPIILLLFRY